MPVIELTTMIKAPLGRCFHLARSIDLHKLSTADTREEAVAGVTSGLIGMGQQVTWRATHFGITQNLTSEITAFKYPSYFRDEMLQGPFKKIVHDHIFEESDGVTLMRDRFEFESPGGIIGRAFNRLVLAKYLKTLLEKRNHMIKEVAEGEGWKTILRDNPSSDQ
jgi:ligand-binding SRPBCC domain-containing protein